MKNLILIISITFLSSCALISVKKKGNSSSSNTTSSTQSNSGKYSEASGNAKDVISKAKKYIGVPYKFGGTSSSGLDCSGLVLRSYEAVNMNMPRVSRDQANVGLKISKSDAQPGDLVFFNTSGKGISHVGIIESIKNGEIYFIHASSSRGVMVSSLNNSYWKPKVVKFTRVL